MKDIDIRRLDLTLLMVLASLLRTRQATQTARQLGVTQSSVSHSLAKLREIFADPLFLRQPHGLEPTPRALALLPTIDAIIDLARAALQPAAFDPMTARRLVRIAATDYPCAVLSGPLLNRLSREAPFVELSFRPLVRRAAVAGLAAGDIDFAIGMFAGASADFDRRPLWDDDYVVVVRKGHPVFRSACALGDYVAARHVLVSQDGDLVGLVDHALAARKMTRQVVAAAPYYLAALAAVADSDAVATMPGAVARLHAARFGLRVFPSPVAVRRLRMSLLSARRLAGDPLTDWLGGVLGEVVRDAVPKTQPATGSGRRARVKAGS